MKKRPPKTATELMLREREKRPIAECLSIAIEMIDHRREIKVCPCLNNGEDGFSCNLGFEIDPLKIDVTLSNYKPRIISYNCRLVGIKTKGMIINPRREDKNRLLEKLMLLEKKGAGLSHEN